MILILRILSYLFVVVTFLPLVRDNFWVFRALEYPRFQKFLLGLILLTAWAVIYLNEHVIDFIAAPLLLIANGYLAFKILPYTVLSKREVYQCAAADDANSLKIFSANVFQENKNYSKMISQIKMMEPNLVFLLETDVQWQKAMDEVLHDFPYKLVCPLSNTYGLLFYSRLKLTEDSKIVFLVKDDIPSIEAKVILPSGKQVQVYGLHPQPPVPGESLRSTAKDKELMKVAFKVRDCQLPCIVIGDLNDVAWSYTTSLFTKVGKLLDVRCGRGFYSTFSAKSWWMRFPLDYIFCTKNFELFKMLRLPKNGSDHFAIFTHLIFKPNIKKFEGDQPDSDDLQVASEMASKAE